MGLSRVGNGGKLIYLDFYRVFVKASHSILVANMKKYQYELEIKGVRQLVE